MKQIKNYCSIIFLLLGAAGFGLREWLFRAFLDARELIIPWSVPEILLWVLTAAAAVLAILAARGTEVKTDEKLLPALGELVLAAGVGSLLLESAKGPATLVLVFHVFCALAAVSLVGEAAMRLMGKKPFFLLTVAPCILGILQLVECYQLWSERPVLLNYVFGVGAVLCILLYCYYRMARAAEMKLKFTSTAVSLLAIFFSAVAVSQGDSRWFFAAAALGITMELSGIAEEAK